ncbi:complement receptor type 2-like isoform X1 [Erpetoichthys calabaricus]|uniref:Complement receptor type 2-like n=1 Tax=Erpetoichthys calabaricus TaxID=27687 RepID=A0A8C4SU62_ERPCA|nr:complement receptor type 2-like isoform X1 [Erpetoichthys calabaricus]
MAARGVCSSILLASLLVLGLAVTSLSAQAATCGMPPNSNNAVPSDEFATIDTFNDGANVTYKCIPGYSQKGGSRTITCRSGMWTTLTLICERKSCGGLPELLNGQYEASSNLFGDTAYASCNEGFNLVGKSYVVCLSSGQWDTNSAVCEDVKCPDPPEIVNGTIVNPPIGTVTYSSVITYKCTVGDLIGESSITCTLHGNYSSAPPQCKVINCADVTVKNGKKESGFTPPYKLGYAITFSCNAGFIMNGSNTIKCREDNQWSPSPPMCLAVTMKTTTISPNTGTLTTQGPSTASPSKPQTGTSSTTKGPNNAGTSSTTLNGSDKDEGNDAALIVGNPLLLLGLAAFNLILMVGQSPAL